MVHENFFSSANPLAEYFKKLVILSFMYFMPRPNGVDVSFLRCACDFFSAVVLDGF